MPWKDLECWWSLELQLFKNSHIIPWILLEDCLLDSVEPHSNRRLVTALHCCWDITLKDLLGTLNCMNLLRDTVFFYQSVKGCYCLPYLLFYFFSLSLNLFPVLYMLTFFFRRILKFNFTNHNIFFILGCFTHCNYWGGRLILAIFIY